MIVISDTNIIFSCFYTPNGAMATILKNEKNKLQFIAPSYLLEEVKEHLPILMERNHLTKKRALDILKEATKNITFYDLEEIKKKNREKAVEVAKDIDPDDYLFIALHFETGHKIWTCDTRLANGLKEKGYDMCITTNEIREKTYKKKEQNFSPIREDFYKQKIVWASVGETYYSLIPEGTFLLDTNYFFSTEDSWFLGFLNSKLITYWINSEDTPIGNGGAYRHYKYNLEKLPIIEIDDLIKISIMKLVKSKEYNKIDQLLYKLYNLSEEEIIFIESI